MNNQYSFSTLTLPEGFKLYLFSISRSRRQVLDSLHIKYYASYAGINEKLIRDPDPKELTMKLAQEKMNTVIKRKQSPHSIYITADQVAVKNGKICEKPTSDRMCFEYLQSYCNSGVELFSAICVYNTDTEKRYTYCDVSRIEFSDIPQEVQEYLVKKGDVYYSCGGITIEDEKFQKYITYMDEYDRIMGIPLKQIQHGIDVTSSCIV